MLDFVLSPAWTLIGLLVVAFGFHAHVCCYGWPLAERLGFFPPCHPNRVAQLQLEADLLASRAKARAN